ncbi:hypothetical protein [Nonomuraea soli]|uniref:Uncharacterized protein n=1 Tax=Nonomuraea soli TaxID=1032476 RepID=A0A7W0CV96_9ACTN|nr:hypothetical protein [Nonomuraea soli]MBA2898007.1 hypothetical protein [Nonomuraea soli]
MSTRLAAERAYRKRRRADDASEQPREGRAIRWGTIITALATVAAVVVAALAYNASKEAVRVSEQQRDLTHQQRLDAAEQFARRVTASIERAGDPAKDPDFDVTARNANTIATVAEFRLTTFISDEGEVIVFKHWGTGVVPACSEVVFRVVAGFRSSAGKAPRTELAVFQEHPLDGQRWSVEDLGGAPKPMTHSEWTQYRGSDEEAVLVVLWKKQSVAECV